MGASASLSSRSVLVEPGQTATVDVTVRNTGAVVDRFDFTVVGDASTWATVEPPSVSLNPATEGVARVRFAPPRDPNIPAGSVPFGVKVASHEDPAGSVVEEGTAQVAAFRDLFAELVPRTSRGRREARHDLALDNRGNAPVQTSLTATDPDGKLSFAFEPPGIAPGAGTAGFSRLTVSAPNRFFKGPPLSHPFQVLVESDNQQPVQVDGVLVQEAVLPPWAAKALLALLALLVAFLLLWLTLFKPAIKSAAKDAVADAGQAAPGDDSGKDGGKDGSTATTATTTDGTTDTTGGGTPTPTPVPTVVPPAQTGTVTDGRLFLTKAGVSTFQVPDGKILELTDIVLQNPDGSAGPVQVRRNGTALLVVALENFRDLDYHFVSPVVFKAGEKLELAAQCKTPPEACTPSVYYSGVLKNA